MEKLLCQCFLIWPIYLSSESAQKLTSRFGLKNSLMLKSRQWILIRKLDDFTYYNSLHWLLCWKFHRICQSWVGRKYDELWNFGWNIENCVWGLLQTYFQHDGRQISLHLGPRLIGGNSQGETERVCTMTFTILKALFESLMDVIYSYSFCSWKIFYCSPIVKSLTLGLHQSFLIHKYFGLKI